MKRLLIALLLVALMEGSVFANFLPTKGEPLTNEMRLALQHCWFVGYDDPDYYPDIYNGFNVFFERPYWGALIWQPKYKSGEFIFTGYAYADGIKRKFTVYFRINTKTHRAYLGLDPVYLSCLFTNQVPNNFSGVYIGNTIYSDGDGFLAVVLEPK